MQEGCFELLESSKSSRFSLRRTFAFGTCTLTRRKVFDFPKPGKTTAVLNSKGTALGSSIMQLWGWLDQLNLATLPYLLKH